MTTANDNQPQNATGSWGVLRYFNGGDSTQPDGLHGLNAVIDGWYAHRSDAEAVRRAWAEECPNHSVLLVQQEA
jgi:hypothetical protein